MENANVNGVFSASSHGITDVKESIKIVGHQLAESAESVFKEIKSSSKDVIETCATQQMEVVENYIRANPVKSVLAALGTGILLSRMFNLK